MTKRKWSPRGAPRDWVAKLISDPPEGCAPWPFGKTNRGIPMIETATGKRSARRLICELVNGPAPSKSYQAAMLCKTDGCASPNCIEWKTRSEIRSGIGGHSSKHVIKGDVLDDVLHSTDSYDVIAARYGIHYSTVSQVRKKHGVRP